MDRKRWMVSLARAIEIRTLGAVLAVVVGARVPEAAQSCAGDALCTWTSSEPLDEPRSEAASAVDGGQIFLFGDKNYDTSTHADTRMFDPVTGSWTSRQPMPTGRGQAAAAAADGRIFVFGGNNCFSNCWLSTVEAYDPALDVWDTDLPSLPGSPRGSLSAETVGDRIYVMGGANSYVLPTFSNNSVFDVATGSWEEGAPLPVPRSHHGSAVVDGRIYLIGGQHRFEHGGEVLVSQVDVYDPTTDTWTQGAAWPSPRIRVRCVSLAGKIYVLGGGVDDGAAAEAAVDVYDPATDTWSCAPALPEPRWEHAAEVLDGVVYVIGGETGSSAVQTSSVFASIPAPTTIPGCFGNSATLTATSCQPRIGQVFTAELASTRTRACPALRSCTQVPTEWTATGAVCSCRGWGKCS